MGCIAGIAHDKFPKQTKSLGTGVKVCFNYDTSHQIEGTIVRDDAEAPFVTVFKLKDGRYVLATECQFTYLDWSKV